MPEIKHQFTKGKMNLDLDERLVPNGEYREAFNIQVLSSEGSDIGTVQNLAGNFEVPGQTTIINNDQYSYNCIGSIADEKNNDLYWFIKPTFNTIGSNYSFEFFEGAYGSLNYTFWKVNSFSPDIYTDLWKWTCQAPLPGSPPSVTCVPGVETTIGQDMIISLSPLEPVLVDQFEVICNAELSIANQPTVTNTSPPFTYNVNDSAVLNVDITAFNAIEVGFVLLGYGITATASGTFPTVVGIGPWIEVVGKQTDGVDFEVEIKLKSNSLAAITAWDDFNNDILNNGTGQAGLIKAFYFQNKAPAVNFRSVENITGINVVDDMLFWTDNHNEPKKINIERSIMGTDPLGLSQTRIVNESHPHEVLAPNSLGRITEQYVTNIKKSPNSPLAMELRTRRETELFFYNWALYTRVYTGIITTNSNVSPQPTTLDDVIGIEYQGSNVFDNTITNLSAVSKGDLIQIDVKEDFDGTLNGGGNAGFDWDVGDTLVLKEYDEDNSTPPPLPVLNYRLKCKIENITTVNIGPGGSVVVDLRIVDLDGVPPSPENGELKYVVDKYDSEDKIFKYKYPRFSYRYKYEDGEYSSFAPFTQVAFVPGGFDYHPKKGHNLAMVNRINHIIVKNFKPDNIPLDVTEIELLYKEDSSNSIYIVDTIRSNDAKTISSAGFLLPVSLSQPKYNHWETNAYKIDFEEVRSVLPENQLLRVYDNVPRKALAQEVTGSRIVYGNYVQNFDLMSSINPFEGFYPQFKHYINSFPNLTVTQGAIGDSNPKRSIKSLREYQYGIIFIDKYGRETPIITSETGSFNIDKSFCDKNNRLSVQMKGAPPSTLVSPFKYFKFYVKEVSGEYYNLAMDRWYDAGDGNVWLSFPSTDANKLIVDDFIILKKGAESYDAVKEPAKYKVLAIENEAPDFIKKQYWLLDTKETTNVLDANSNPTGPLGVNTIVNQPTVNAKGFELNYRAYHQTSGSDLHGQFKDADGELYVQFSFGNQVTEKYKINSLTTDLELDQATGNPTNVEVAKYYIKLEDNLGEDVGIIFDAFPPSEVVVGAQVRIFKQTKENKPEFDGRFFVKIYTDDIFGKYIQSSYDPTDNITDYYVSSSIKTAYMSKNHKTLHDGFNVDDNYADYGDSSGNKYHAGCGFPIGPINHGAAGDTPFGWWSSNNMDSFNAYSHVQPPQYAYVNSQGPPENPDPNNVGQFGLRHYAPFFRLYTEASNPTLIDITDPSSNGTPVNLPIEMVVDGSSSTIYDQNTFANVNPVYKFENTYEPNGWQQEYGRYTGITNKVWATTKQTGGVSNTWFGGSQPTLSEFYLQWFTSHDGYKRKSDRNIRETEVWYINEGPYAARNWAGDSVDFKNSIWDALGNTGLGPGDRLPGITTNPSGVQFNLSLGGIDYTPTADSDVSFPHTDEFDELNIVDIFDIGGANQSYQDSQTEQVVNSLSPNQYFRFKEDPSKTVYNIQSVNTRNLLNYADSALMLGTYREFMPTNIFGDSSQIFNNDFSQQVTTPRWNSSSQSFEGGPSHYTRGELLSCNFSKNWRLSTVNTDANNLNVIPWNPVGYPGPITGGSTCNIVVNTNTNSGTQTLQTSQYAVYTDSIFDSITNASLEVGMIVVKRTTSGGSATSFTENIASISDNSSYIYLQVLGIEDSGAFGFKIILGGYMRPLLLMDAIAFTNGDTLQFTQARMNGYSSNSVRKIFESTKADSAFNTGSITHENSWRAVEYNIEFLSKVEIDGSILSENPAVWETEPQDLPDLDIYHEASGRIPIDLNEDLTNDFIPTKYVWDPDLLTPISSSPSPYSNTTLNTFQSVHNPHGSYQNSVITTNITGFDYSSIALTQGFIEIVQVKGNELTMNCNTPAAWGSVTLTPGSILSIRRPDMTVFKTKVVSHNINASGGITPLFDTNVTSGQIDVNNPVKIVIDSKTWNSYHDLNYHNCYSFNNGVESNRIRDNYNTSFISKGVRVSTVADSYKQERREYGLIYSGIYNSISGMNSLNQFIQAEKITKDINPIYSSIQKLHSRSTADGDLITICEDRVLKILANKDAVFNADGNINLTSTNSVLGQAIPYAGEFGISKNPESFAAYSYRAYFTDRTRGAVLRLSKDGLTPVSEAGMKDWFRDNLELSDRIIGSYDERQDEYNLKLNPRGFLPSGKAINVEVANDVVVSYSEKNKGWSSFKSFGQMEQGNSMGNDYFTFLKGKAWLHHAPANLVDSNTFYGDYYNSSINVLLNDTPSVVKSFKTIGYEGSLPLATNSGYMLEIPYQQTTVSDGWFVGQMQTDLEFGQDVYFTEKEGKYFSNVKGASDVESPDINQFTFQGIGTVNQIIDTLGSI